MSMPTIARPPEDIFRDIRCYLNDNPSVQRVLAAHAGVHQSTISRIKAGETRVRLSNGLLRLCNYAGIAIVYEIPASTPDPRDNHLLMAALGEVWDGSHGHAKALAKLIRDLKRLSAHHGSR